MFKNGLKDGYFRSISYRLCLLMTMHCVWYWIRCTAQLYYSHASASVIATRWILTNSPRCDGINLCCGVVRSEPGELINIHLIALSSKRLHLKVVFRYQTQVEAYLLNWAILSPETWLSIIWQKNCLLFLWKQNCAWLLLFWVILSAGTGLSSSFLVCWKGT